ncbi:MAG: substrate-binding domain-containing protein [Fimbriimonadaceae bacterium]|nr:substrate-binding domain-containing protein [Fimbriimonadaceae bacterium]
MPGVESEPLRSSLPEQVASRLRRQLGAGRYPVGGYLPGERELAAELGVSRRTMARALELLDRDGLIERAPRRGTRVRGGAPADHLTLLLVAAAGTPIVGEFWGLQRGVQAAVERHGAQLRRWEPATFDPTALAAAGDGVVFLEAGDERQMAAALDLEARRVPVAVANLERPLTGSLAVTRVDHAAVAQAATELLLNLGHRRIAWIGQEPARYFYDASHDGYAATLAAAGIAYHPALVVRDGRPLLLAGYLGTQRLLALPQPPTALVAARDGYAEGALQAIWEAGLTPGRDLSVVGYDDLSASPTGDPLLTTFAEPVEELGALAVELVVERCRHGWRPPVDRLVPAPLRIRRSAGPLIPAPRPVAAGGAWS